MCCLWSIGFGPAGEECAISTARTFAYLSTAMAYAPFHPRFRFRIREDRETIESLIGAQIKANNPADLRLRKVREKLVLRFPSNTSRIWTPQLVMEVRARKEGGSELYAFMGPSYPIWRFFRTILKLCVGMGVIAFILLFFQGANGLGTWGSYLLMASLACGLFLYFLSEEGKRRSRNEMELLKTFMDDALGRELFQPEERRKTSGVLQRST